MVRHGLSLTNVERMRETAQPQTTIGELHSAQGEQTTQSNTQGACRYTIQTHSNCTQHIPREQPVCDGALFVSKAHTYRSQSACQGSTQATHPVGTNLQANAAL